MKYTQRKSLPSHMQAYSRKIRFMIKFCETAHIPLDNGMWNGGSQSTITSHRLSDGMPTMKQPKRGQFMEPRRESEVWEIEPGTYLVSQGTFCGKPSTPCLYINPQDMDPFSTEEM